MKRSTAILSILAFLGLAAYVSMPRQYAPTEDCPCGRTIFGCFPCPDVPPAPKATPKPAPTPKPQVQPKECSHWDLWVC